MQAEVTDPTGSVVGLLDLLAAHSRTPSRSAAALEATAAVERALSELKDDYRQALLLRYVEGLSVSDVADRMNRSDAAVLMLCQRALRQLHLILGDSADYLSRKE